MKHFSACVKELRAFPTDPGVYFILNVSNNRIYVGETIRIRDRLLAHYYELASGRHGNPRLQLDWDDFGEHHFDFGILANCKDVSERNIGRYLWKLERLFIRTYQASNPIYGYNKHEEAAI